MGVESGIRSDMQNVTSATPFAGGTMASNASATSTATGASIVMNAAQQRLISKKYQAQQGLRREANMRLKNCQQFMDGPRLAHIIGKDGALRFKEIEPLEIQGEYLFELLPMGESQMRQEKRAEATQFFQVASAAAPLFAASGQPFNMRELFTWMAERWDILDHERFFSQNSAALGAAAQGGQGSQGGPPGAEGPNLGITSGSAVDASSPSAVGGISGSPVEAIQRALAMGGGANNQGGS